MKALKLLVAACAAVTMTLAAEAAKTAKAVVADEGKTLKFVYDETNYGTKGAHWFSVAEAEASDPTGQPPPWYAKRSTVTKVVFDGTFADYKPKHCGHWFYAFVNLETIDGLSNLNTSLATSFVYMFSGCASLSSLDLTGFNTANATDMRCMFYNSQFETIFVSDAFVTTAVTESEDMFRACPALKGGAGTEYDRSKTDKTYARIDGGPSAPGYFTRGRLARAVVEDGGATLRFVYDDEEPSGTKGMGWFSIAEAEAKDPSANPPWHDCCHTITKVVIDPSFADYRPKHCRRWFFAFAYLETIEGLSNLDTSAATSFTSMFEGCTLLTSLDLSGFDTANVTEMYSMFCYCTGLERIYASDRFVTEQVENPELMFHWCMSLRGGNGTKYDSSKTDKTYARIDKVGAPGYFTRGRLARVVVEDDATLRFVYDNKEPSGTKGTHWFSVKDAEAIDPYSEPAPWYGKHGTVTKVVFDESFAGYRPKQCGGWFNGFSKLATIENIGKLDTSEATSLAGMFANCSSLTSLDVTGFNTANVTDMTSIFYGCSSLTSLDVSGFNTANVTKMHSMFDRCSSLTTLDVTGFDTANVTDMYAMFYLCLSLKSLDVTGFDTANVTDMTGMFYYCSSLTSLNVTGFDTANVTDMGSMFENCSSLTTLDVTGFDTAKVTTMGSMFSGCSSLTSLDLSGFNTAKMTQMYCMFYGCSSLTTIAASDAFVTTAVFESENMFKDCTSLKGGEVTKYEEANPTDKNYARIDGGASAPGYFTRGSVYTVDFIGNGATSGSMPSHKYGLGKVYNLPKCKFRKLGAAFKGWAGSNGRRYDDGVLIFDAAREGAELRLTAIWE